MVSPSTTRVTTAIDGGAGATTAAAIANTINEEVPAAIAPTVSATVEATTLPTMGRPVNQAIAPVTGTPLNGSQTCRVYRHRAPPAEPPRARCGCRRTHSSTGE